MSARAGRLTRRGSGRRGFCAGGGAVGAVATAPACGWPARAGSPAAGARGLAGPERGLRGALASGSWSRSSIRGVALRLREPSTAAAAAAAGGTTGSASSRSSLRSAAAARARLRAGGAASSAAAAHSPAAATGAALRALDGPLAWLAAALSPSSSSAAAGSCPACEAFPAAASRARAEACRRRPPPTPGAGAASASGCSQPGAARGRCVQGGREEVGAAVCCSAGASTASAGAWKLREGREERATTSALRQLTRPAIQAAGKQLRRRCAQARTGRARTPALS